jgi:NAD(P)-dependent dehydrogenase (short-subunit alcohol dehydrogenase family)
MWRCDMAAPEEVDRLVNDVTDVFGGVDVLINNAGGGVGGSQWMVGDRDEGREVFETNFWSPLALVQALVPAMRNRGAGAVVNVTSISQVMPWGGLGHYSATKAALASATETLRLELAGSGVHVLEVIAGPIDTAIQAETRLVAGFAQVIRLMPVGDPDILARLTLRALERHRKRLVYPRALAGAYAAPGVVRRSTEVLARRFPGAGEDARIVRGGSSGDALARDARAAWEKAKGVRPL